MSRQANRGTESKKMVTERVTRRGRAESKLPGKGPGAGAPSDCQMSPAVSCGMGKSQCGSFPRRQALGQLGGPLSCLPARYAQVSRGRVYLCARPTIATVINNSINHLLISYCVFGARLLLPLCHYHKVTPSR